MATEGGLLQLLPDDERRRVLAAAPLRRFARGDIIFHEGDPGDSLHVIAKGHVAVRGTTRLGDVAIFRVIGPGELLGEQSLLVPDARRVATAVALEKVESHTLQRDDFEALRREHREIDRFLVEALVGQVRRLSTHLQEALFVPSEIRVLRRLLELCDSYTGSDGRALIPLTQDDIASLAGASRTTANRVLRAAEEAGLLSIARRQIEVLDLEGLADRAR